MIWAGGTVPVYGMEIPIELEAGTLDSTDLGEFRGGPEGWKIYVSPLLDEATQDNTLSHEVVHAWIELSGLREVPAIKKNEELIANAFAPLLTQLLVRFSGEDE